MTMKIAMRVAGAAVLGLVAGAAVGFALSELVALLGLLLFDRPVGLRYLPIVLAAAGGMVAVAVLSRRDRRNREEAR
jgi:hypothetical protein